MRDADEHDEATRNLADCFSFNLDAAARHALQYGSHLCFFVERENFF
jgi:hypothetical protein